MNKTVKIVLSVLCVLVLCVSTSLTGVLLTARVALDDKNVETRLLKAQISVPDMQKTDADIAAPTFDLSTAPQSTSEVLREKINSVIAIIGTFSVEQAVRGEKAQHATSAALDAVETHLADNSVFLDLTEISDVFSEAYAQFCVDSGIISRGQRDKCAIEVYANFTNDLRRLVDRDLCFTKCTVGDRFFFIALSGEHGVSFRNDIDSLVSSLGTTVVESYIINLIKYIKTGAAVPAYDEDGMYAVLMDGLEDLQDRYSFKLKGGGYEVLQTSLRTYVAARVVPKLEKKLVSFETVGSQIGDQRLNLIRFALGNGSLLAAAALAIISMAALVFLWRKRLGFLVPIGIGLMLGGILPMLCAPIATALGLNTLLSSLNAVSGIGNLDIFIKSLCSGAFRTAQFFGTAALGIGLLCPIVWLASRSRT
ncbi:MAG: hypothetical protein RR998_00180 [Oscillospiraceae bacterium]